MKKRRTANGVSGPALSRRAILVGVTRYPGPLLLHGQDGFLPWFDTATLRAYTADGLGEAGVVVNSRGAFSRRI